MRDDCLKMLDTYKHHTIWLHARDGLKVGRAEASCSNVSLGQACCHISCPFTWSGSWVVLPMARALEHWGEKKTTSQAFSPAPRNLVLSRSLITLYQINPKPSHHFNIQWHLVDRFICSNHYLRVFETLMVTKTYWILPSFQWPPTNLHTLASFHSSTNQGRGVLLVPQFRVSTPI